MTGLPVSSVVKVQVNLGPVSAQAQSLSNLLILGSSGIIDTVQRVRSYSTLTAVAADFGTSVPEYLAAVEWFNQTPQPGLLLIGQWVSPAAYPSGTFGALKGSTISSNVSAWQAITTGSFVATVGSTVYDISGLNFSTVTNLNGVASIIQAALIAAGLSTAIFTWNSVYSQFTFNAGIQSNIAFLTALGSGVDISGLLGMKSTSSGAYQIPFLATSESAVSCVALFDSLFGQKWYSAFIIAGTDSDHLAVAAFIEGTNTKHAYAVNSQEAGIITSTDTSNIAYQLKQLGYTKTSVQYSSNSLYAAVAYQAKALIVDWTANNSTITLAFKQEAGIIPENLTETQYSALVANNANVFVEYDNNTAIIQTGVQSSGDYTDTIYGADWLAITIQNNVYNTLYTSPTKIPQTDPGNHILYSSIVQVLDQGVDNSFLAPGTWTQTGFGTLSQGDYLPKGYYVYQPPVSSQSDSTRATRVSVTFQVAAKLSGAIQAVDVIVNLNR